MPRSLKNTFEVLTGDQTSARVPVITGIHFSTRAIENVNKLEQQKDYVYFSTHEGLNAEIKDFSSSRMLLSGAGLNASYMISISAILSFIASSLNIFLRGLTLMKNAERVERHEIRRNRTGLHAGRRQDS